MPGLLVQFLCHSESPKSYFCWESEARAKYPLLRRHIPYITNLHLLVPCLCNLVPQLLAYLPANLHLFRFVAIALR